MQTSDLERAPTDSIPLLVREPYRLMFPIGAALAFAGVGHWLLHAVGVLDDFRPIFHAMTQVQGFLMAFAVGFLFTMIPRRTASPPPSVVAITIGALAPIGVAAFAWFGLWMWSQLCWLVLAFTVLGFVLRRLRGRASNRRPPNSFVWIPVAFVFGVGGSVLTGFGAALAGDYWWMHELGRSLVLQGMFIALVLGVGGLAIPLMTRGEAPPDADGSPAHRRERALHVVGVLLLLGSFAVEQWVSLRSGFALRAAVIMATLVLSARVHVPPTRPGLVRHIIWVAAWLLPMGFAFGAVFHEEAKAFLHLSFIGGLALLTLAVSTQVALGHGGFSTLVTGRPNAAFAIAGFVVLSIVPRLLMAYDPARYFLWMGVAAALFLAALLSWAAFVVPKLSS
ncbi:MAG: NnrS family protein [Deltaproteobacteria bacterium]|jgi:uncharacterized protein involved in response to NO